MADLDARKAALIAQLAAQRAQLSGHARIARQSLDVKARVKAGFSAHPFAWLSGAGIVGLVLTQFPSRKKALRQAVVPEKKRSAAGMAWLAVTFLFNLARPALTAMLTARLAGRRAGETARREARR